MPCKQGTLEIDFVHMKVFFKDIVVFDTADIESTADADDAVEVLSELLGLSVNIWQLSLNFLVTMQNKVSISFIVFIQVNR